LVQAVLPIVQVLLALEMKTLQLQELLPQQELQSLLTLDISGDVDVDGTLETDALSIASTTITATAAELNYTDGVTSAIQTQLDTKATTGKAIAMALVFG
jgi:hypothetical protein